MCGIFAMFLNRPLAEQDIEVGRRGTAMLTHRGPDGKGEFADRDRGVFLGHRRLKVVDLSERAAQPMMTGTTVISFNGEIYNHKELRKDLLEKGEVFESHSDTEALLKGWVRWGGRALDRIDGMFAFALWDGEVGILAADPFGEKPLYYAQTKDGTVAASEIRCLAQTLGSVADLQGTELAAFMALGFVPAPSTAYPGIRRVRPGTYLVIRRGKVEQEVVYWRTPSGEPGKGPVRPLPEKALDAMQEALATSLASRLVADVPLCLFGSGGVDSSLVAGIAGRDLKADVEVLTIAYPGTEVDESQAASDIAQTFGLAHRVVEGDRDLGTDGLIPVLDLFGQPNDNMSIMASVQLARVARRYGYVVGLVGSGGDEAFFGYLKQQFFWRHRRLMAVPEFWRMLVMRLTAPIASFSDKVRLFQDLVAVPDGERYLAVKNQPAYAALRAIPQLGAWAAGTYGHCARPLELQVPEIERDQVLPGSQLDAVDLGSMHASVELRTPFLSRQLFEIVAEFDPRSFLAFGQKSVARRLVARYLPAQRILEGKRGFVFPQRDLLAGISRKPTVAGIPSSVVDDVWANRMKGGGWVRLALRLALVDAFARWSPA